jgi:ribosomal protein S18 acetylase RimI-like enzyme
MKFVQVKYPDVKLLEQFIADAGSSLKSFRYFQKRPLEVIKNHLCTFLLLEEDKPVAYGHLDVTTEAEISAQCGSEEKVAPTKETIWLGVAVSEKYIGLGLGVMMMNQLISFAKHERLREIKLSVDNDNVAAIKMYEKLGFKLLEKKEVFSFYQLTLAL